MTAPTEPQSFALADNQSAIWFDQMYTPSTTRHHISMAVRLSFDVDVDVSMAVLQHVIDSHPALRTTFHDVDGLPFQTVHDHMPAQLEVEDTRSWSAADVDDRLRAHHVAPFQLDTGPLVRFLLLRQADDEHLVSFVLHHLIGDMWSVALLGQAIAAGYEDALHGNALPAAQQRQTYQKFVEATDSHATGESSEPTREYWRPLFDHWDAPTLLMDHPDAAENIGTVDNLAVDIEPALRSQLTATAAELELPLRSLLIACLHATLRANTGADQTLIGELTANRSLSRSRLIGCCTNQVSRPAHFDQDTSLRELAQNVHAQILESRPHERYPFVRLLRELRPGHGSDPFFGATFALQKTARVVDQQLASALSVNEDNRASEVGGLQVEPVAMPIRSSPANLTLIAVMSGADLGLSFEYQDALFDLATVERLAHGLQTMLSVLVAAPDTPVDAIDVTTASERASWSTPSTDVGSAASTVPVPRLIEQQAQLTPDAVALRIESSVLTHGELDQRANQLARRLIDDGVGRSDIIGVCLERSIDTIVSMLGIWKSGAAFVPMDPSLPAQRLEHMVDDAALRLVITDSVAWSGVVSPEGSRHATPGGTLTTIETICLDVEATQISELSREHVEHTVADTDTAYVFFTSGSTGRPKGVASEHRNVSNFLTATIKRLGITSADAILASTTFSFDPSVLELFAPLVEGGHVDVVSRDVVVDPELLAHAVDRVTVAQGTPTMWKMLLESGWQGNSTLTCLSGGELLTREVANKLLARCGTVWNLYGPTETTVWSSAARVSLESGPASIGDPLDNVHFHVLNDRLERVPTGRQGELWIGGAGVSPGYIGQRALTAERFVDDPFAADNSTMYRTGDLVRRLPDGRLEFRGRIDHQVKLRGHRIELGDIESALERTADVDRAVVIVYEFGADDSRLVAYFTRAETHSDRAGASDPDALRQQIRGELPAYMIPATFVPLDRFSLTASNKIDRNQLPDPRQQTRVQRRAAVLPAGADAELLDAVVEAFRDVFADDAISGSDDFFDLGGHSMLATQIVSRLRNRLSREVALRALFEHPTPADLAAFMSRVHGPSQNTSGQSGVFVMPTENASAGDHRTFALSFSQERMWFVHKMHPRSAAYNLAAAVRVTGDFDIRSLVDAVRQIVDRHTSLRSRFIEQNGAPRLQVEPTVDVEVPITDLRFETDLELRDQALTDALETEANRPFDLAALPLFRIHAYRTADRDLTISIVMHHIISDQWSLGVFAHEVVALLTARLGDTPSPVALEPHVRAETYGEWQRHQFEIGVHNHSLGYWRNQLKDLPTVQLPTDRPRPEIASTRGDTITHEFPAELLDAVRSTAADHNATEFMVLLAAFNSLIHRITGDRDIVVGVPIANRHWLESEALITTLVNTLVMRNQIFDTDSRSELLTRVRDVALDAYAHQDVPFGRLVQELSPPRTLSQSPLFQLFFNVQNAPFEQPVIDGLNIDITPIRRNAAQFDLSLNIDLSLSNSISLEFATDLFDRPRMEQLLEDFIEEVTRITADSTATVSSGPTSVQAAESNSPPRALPDHASTPSGAPVDDLEQQVAEVWGQVLGTSSIDRHDNFFDLGGHSILAINVFAELERRTGRRPPLTTLFQAPTVATFADVLRSEGWMSPWTSMIELRPDSTAEPLFYVAPYLVSALSMYELAQQLGDEIPMYVFQPQGIETDHEVHGSVEEMAEHYIREMRTVQPNGPYSLGGHCAGGWVAFEMTRQLQASGFEVNHLIVVDIEPPGVLSPPTKWVRLVVSRLVVYGRHGQVVDAVKWKLGRSLERMRARRSARHIHSRVERVRYLHEEAHRRYRGGSVDGDMVFIRSQEWSSFRDKDWHLNWSQLISGDLHVAEVPGAHSRLLHGASASGLARLVRRQLRPRKVVPNG